VVDDNGDGPGTGATVSLTITGGVITGASITAAGSGYIYPVIVISDPANSGSGAEISVTLDNSATFTASASVFSSGDVGDVIRMGGGVATITAFTSGTEVTANITQPIADVRTDAEGNTLPTPQEEGSWSQTTPVSSISGLTYLAGATVTGLADGVVIDPVVVPATGVIDLPQASTNVVVGLGFTAQLQSVYIHAGDSPTVQGQRKKVGAVTVRVDACGPFNAGGNQVDGSTVSPPKLAPTWSNLTPVPLSSVAPFGSTVKPLYTGDIRVPISGGWDTKGQVAVQQAQPFHLNVLAFIPEMLPGDYPDVKVEGS
jgi:hypothetical protein